MEEYIEYFFVSSGSAFCGVTIKEVRKAKIMTIDAAAHIPVTPALSFWGFILNFRVFIGFLINESGDDFGDFTLFLRSKSAMVNFSGSSKREFICSIEPLLPALEIFFFSIFFPSL